MTPHREAVGGWRVPMGWQVQRGSPEVASEVAEESVTSH